MWFRTALCGALIRLAEHSLECLCDVGIVSGADLDPSGLELCGELLCFGLGDLPLDMQIALLTNNDTGDGFGARVIEDLVVDGLDHVEAIAGCDAVDEHVAVDANGVFGIENRVFILAGCVDDVAVVFLALVGDGFLEDVFNGGVVRVDKGVFDVSNDQGGFACESGIEPAVKVRGEVRVEETDDKRKARGSATR